MISGTSGMAPNLSSLSDLSASSADVSACDALVDLLGALGHRRQAEALLGRGTGTLAHGLAHRGVDQHASKCRCQAVYVPVVHQQSP